MTDNAQAHTCPFCAIVAGRLPAYIVYADDVVTAFLDKNPINPGHVLVIPNRHTPDFFDMDDDTLCRVMRVAKRVAGAVRRVAAPLRVGLGVIGFDVPHAHLHVVPLQGYHDITSSKILDGTRLHPSDAEQARTAADIAAAL